MPTYIGLFKWTDQGAKNAKESLTRDERTQALVEERGGRLIGSWWTQGAYDRVTVTEWPDDETASAFAIWLAIGGNIRGETMRAYTRVEMQGILQKMP